MSHLAADDAVVRMERARRERDALLQLARDMSSGAPSANRVLVHLAATAQAFTASEGACVLELQPEVFRVAAPTGIAVPYDQLAFQIMPPPSLFREAYGTRSVVITNDGLQDPRVDPRFRDALQLRHVAVAPIIVDGNVDGLLVVLNSTQPGGYSAEDAEFLQRLADFSAVALRDAELVRRAEQTAEDARRQARDTAIAARRNAVLARTAEALASAASPDAVYHRIGEIVHELLGASGFAIYDVNVESRQAALTFQTGAGVVNAEQASQMFWDTNMADVVQSGTPLFVNDFTQGTDAGRLLAEPLRRAGVGALAILPLRLTGRVSGLMSIRFSSVREHDASEHAFLEAFAAQVAVALRNARHVRDLGERARRLTTLAQAQQRVSGILDADALCDAVLDALGMVVAARTYELLDVDAAGRTTCLRRRQVPRSGDAPRATVELSVPMESIAHPSRVIRLESYDERGFDVQDVDLVAILARHAVQASDTVRLFGAQDTERQRAEAAADLARAALASGGLVAGVTAMLAILDRVAPTTGKAMGVARARDGRLEYVAGIGSLESLVGHRPAGPYGVLGIAPRGAPIELPSLRDEAPETVKALAPDERVLVLPLMARERALGALLASTTVDAPWSETTRASLERLSASVALALDALLLDEEERQAREREHMLATALTTLDHPVFILENDIIRYANPASAREYGWPAAELVGRRFTELVVSVTPVMPRLGDEADPVSPAAEHVHRRRDGSEFAAAVTMSPLRTEAGVVHGAVVSVRDVTADRAFAEQLRHSEKMVALGELVAGVAHEINNPLTGISAFAELLLEDPLDDEQRESVQLIKRESDRATAVIRDLLLFARKNDAPVGPVDLNALVEQTLRLRAYVLRSADIEVTLDLDNAVPLVQGDAQRLQQVLLNLVTNAEHAMEGRPRRRLTLATRCDADRVLVRVEDTGRGMSPTVRRRLFEPFFTTKPPGIGTGLGLSVSYGIVQAHDGTIEVHSEVDAGTSVTLTLPRLPVVDDDATAPA